jgi:chromosome segregation ATPase
MKKMIYCNISIILLVTAGCVRIVDEPIPVEHRLVEQQSQSAKPPRVIVPDDEKIEKRFKDTSEGSVSVVESALLWSRKYDQLSEKTQKLREQNTKLQIENNQLKTKVAKLQVELDQTNKELTEANQFLQELQLELTRWKKDVLGFRDEIKRSQSAQLKALTRILKVLGAEPVTAPKNEQEKTEPDE